MTPDKHGYGPFVCSDGWLDKFKRRNGISVRRITGTAQKIPAIAPTLAAVFYNDISKVITSQGEVQRHCIHVGLYKRFILKSYVVTVLLALSNVRVSQADW